MKGLIISGGKGTRLYPLTYTRAKQLIPVANKPVLYRVIEALKDAGIEEIGVVVGHTAAEIQSALGDGSNWGVRFTFIQQKQPEGLAQTVQISRDFLGDDPFVMFLGDNVLQGGITGLVHDFRRNEANAQLVLKEVSNPSAFGVVALDERGQVQRLVEKPADPPSNLALVGIYLFDATIHAAVNGLRPSARGEYEITDAIQQLIDGGGDVRAHIHPGWWIDTGKPLDLLEANSLVLDELLPTIAESAVIQRSQLDSRVTVEAGAVIEDCVIRGPSIIGREATLRHCYVGPFTSIYHDVRVEHCEIERSIILEHSQLENLPQRLADSLIGRYAHLQPSGEMPRALKMNLGDFSTIWVGATR